MTAAHRAPITPPTNGSPRKFGVVVFPGSNCDHDAYHVLKDIYRQDVRFLWHKESRLDGVDAIILPGGFSYGDYLRCGAIARFSPIMREVISFARDGGMVIGICNGFQILCEAGLLPGSLLRNANLSFVCEYVRVRVENPSTAFTAAAKKGDVLKIPVAHGDGNYFADKETIDRLERNNQVIFRYCDAAGRITAESNPNGSLRNIAGIVNERGNVMGMMPHPERASDPALGETDGSAVFMSVIGHLINAKQTTHATIS